MLSWLSRLLLLLLAVLSLQSCRRDHPQCIDPWATTGIDSVAFRKDHHYWKNYNLVVTDSVPLLVSVPGEVASIFAPDSSVLMSDDEIVVANLAIVPTDTIDSVWVMVARDQQTMGWVREQQLMERSIPDHPISRFIHQFSDSRFLVFLTCLCLAFGVFIVQRFRKEHFLIVHFNDIRSFYPTLLCLGMSGAAAFYGSLQPF